MIRDGWGGGERVRDWAAGVWCGRAWGTRGGRLAWLPCSDAGRVAAGLGRYRAVRAGLDHLVRADQLELLLSKRSSAGAAAGDPGARVAEGP